MWFYFSSSPGLRKCWHHRPPTVHPCPHAFPLAEHVSPHCVIRESTQVKLTVQKQQLGLVGWVFSTQIWDSYLWVTNIPRIAVQVKGHCQMKQQGNEGIPFEVLLGTVPPGSDSEPAENKTETDCPRAWWFFSVRLPIKTTINVYWTDTQERVSTGS